jgi:hypothetical protein
MPERRLHLRLLIPQRIERIDLVWSPTLLGADKLGLPKKPYAVATVRFRNRASQMVIFPSRDSARVLKLGPETKLQRGLWRGTIWGVIKSVWETLLGLSSQQLRNEPSPPASAALAVEHFYKIWSASCLSFPLTNCPHSFRMLWSGYPARETSAGVGQGVSSSFVCWPPSQITLTGSQLMSARALGINDR